MTSSLTDRIAKKQKQKKNASVRVAKTEFLALQIDIKEALDAGWPIKAVWETLYDEGKISCRYDAFRKYVITLIKPNQVNTREGKQSQVKQKENDVFTYNPVPNLEELI